MKTKVYLSGCISNDPDFKQKFAEMEDIVAHHYGEVVNPCKWDEGTNKPWIFYICRDIYRIWFGGFTHILMLQDWEQSYGAQIERLVAQKRSIKVVYEEASK